jgi:CRISPR system Cascade subunit CasA
MSYNLVDQPFIPCRMPDGSRLELGLREMLARAHEIREIRDDSPLVTISLHRLLLAVLHRNFGPSSLDEWARVWSPGRLEANKLGAYFDQWHDRFDLCDAQHPFYQCSAMEECEAVPVTRLAFVQGNNATLFDHRTETDDAILPPAVVARLLIAYQTFAIGGGISKPFNLCHSPVLAQGAYLALATGDNLFQTLALNLLCYDDRRPMPRTSDDCPAWECRQPRTPDRKGTPVDGYLDYLTWQSRRIRLLPANDGQVGFGQMHMLQGLRAPDNLSGVEPMAAFAKVKTGEMRAKSFQEGRSLWRDSQPLFQEIADQQRPPLVLTQLEQLKRRGVLDPNKVFRLAAFGVSTDQAKIAFWRHEAMPLPLAFLGDESLLGSLSDALEAAESAAGGLYGATRRLAEILSTSEQIGRPDKDRVAQLVRSLSPDGRYWAQLEEPFRRLLLDLPGADDQRKTRLCDWRQEVCDRARAVFEQIASGMEASPRVLKAIYTDQWGAQKVLNVELSKILQLNRP